MKRIIEVDKEGQYMSDVSVELLSEVGLPDEYITEIIYVMYWDCKGNILKSKTTNNTLIDNEIIEKAIDEFKMSL